MKKEYRESGLKQKRQQEGELPSREEVETAGLFHEGMIQNLITPCSTREKSYTHTALSSGVFLPRRV